MPAEPSAATPAAPAITCFRVYFIGGSVARGLDADQVPEDLREVELRLREGDRRGPVLADRVERVLVRPGVEDVPLVGALVDAVLGDAEAGDRARRLRVREARDLDPADLVAAAEEGVLAGRHLRRGRVAAEVDVQLAAGGSGARLLPDEALEVAAVLRDAVDVVPAAADLPGQRVGQPGRAIDRRLDAVREALPARAVLARRRHRRGRCLRVTGR